MPERYQRSGPRNPCPACGRVKDADCAWNDDSILCHQGSEPRPTDKLRPGQTIEINGQLWALIRSNAGYSGCADLLKPHSDRKPVLLSKIEQVAYDSTLNKATAHLASQRQIFLALVSKVRGHIDPYWLTLEELESQQIEQERAWLVGSAYTKEANIIGRHRVNHREDLRIVARLLKEVNYQRKDTRAFRSHYLGEAHGG
jgi:hypothetical protein